MVNDILDDLCETTSEVEYKKRIEDMKNSWIEMENRFTKNNPPNQFSSYFEKFKQESLGALDGFTQSIFYKRFDHFSL